MAFAAHERRLHVIISTGFAQTTQTCKPLPFFQYNAWILSGYTYRRFEPVEIETR